MKYLILIIVTILWLMTPTLAQEAKQQNTISDAQRGIELYKKSDFNEAEKVLKAAVKKDETNASAWYYLGAIHLKRSELKTAQKEFEKALKIKNDYSAARTALAYVYLLREEDFKAATEARAALKLNPTDYEAEYISGVVNYRDASYNSAYKSAEKAIAVNPSFANAYLLKSEALAQSFGILRGAVTKAPNERADLLKDAAQSLETYLKLNPQATDAAEQRDRIQGLKYLSEHFARIDSQPLISTTPENVTPLKILAKPRANYTDAARQRGTSGTVRLSVLFAADGKIRYVITLSKLDGGLTEQAIKAARAITFEPERKDGQPISTVKTIEYNFNIR